LKKFYLYILILLLFTFKLNAQNIEVFANTDTTEYIVGDYIKYSLEIKYDKNIKVTIPSVKDSINNLDFIRADTPIKEENGSQVIEIHNYIFSKYDSSEVTIPSYNIPFTIDGTTVNYVKVNPVDIVVQTIEVDAQGDIQDVKSPIKIKLDWLFIGLLTLVIIIVLVAAYLVYRYIRKRRTPEIYEKKIIRVPPHIKAIESLHGLEDKKLWQQGLTKEYHSDITGIVREYFEERYNILALEMTSSELIESLGNQTSEKEIVSIVNGFLSNADLVKFAKFKPIPSVNEEMMTQAYSIVDKTKNVEQQTEIEVVKEEADAE